MLMRKELRLKNEVGELERVNQFVEEIGEELGLDMELQMNHGGDGVQRHLLCLSARKESRD